VVAHGGPTHTARPAGTAGSADLRDRTRSLLEHYEQSWSRFRPTSELSRLNEDPRPSVPVSNTLGLILTCALAAWRATDGWFNPSVHDAVVAAGYDRSYELFDGRSRPPSAGVPVVGAEEIQLDRAEARTIVHRPPGLRLDLGGIGKGLAADLVARSLVADGFRSVCISVGGDVRTAGVAPEHGWMVPVADAYRVGHAFTARLTSGAIAASSTAVRRWPTDDGGWSHHLIDPSTGAPSCSGVTSVVVAAAEAWWSECLAKAALVAGERNGATLLERSGVSGWMSLGDGRVIDVGAQRSGGALTDETSSGAECRRPPPGCRTRRDVQDQLLYDSFV
jgi:thiamine biosynthesis lipoprotein